MQVLQSLGSKSCSEHMDLDAIIAYHDLVTAENWGAQAGDPSRLVAGSTLLCAIKTSLS